MAKVANLKALHHCDMPDTVRIVTISTLYRCTENIDIVSVTQNTSDLHRKDLETDPSTNFDLIFSPR